LVSAGGAADRLRDALWGEVELGHPALEELVQTAPVQRLRGISMAGASCYLFPERKTATRFAHSLGVMHMLRTLGASLQEQVAGLLHDIPHTAFSHTIDIVYPSDEYNYHERFQHDIVQRSAIPGILARYGISIDVALQPAAFRLLERPLPDLCADRIDYALRDLHTAGIITSSDAHDFVTHLVPSRRGLLVDDLQAALRFGRLYIRANDTLWTGPAEAGAYWALAGAIRRAYATGDFDDADIFSTDDAAMQKLRRIDDTVVQSYLALLEPGTLFYEVQDDGPYFTTHMKQRSLDPMVKEPGWAGARRLSRLSEEYALALGAAGDNPRRTYRLWSKRIGPELQSAVDSRYTRPDARPA
jgi:HD superfamily phosphohydrolase